MGSATKRRRGISSTRSASGSSEEDEDEDEMSRSSSLPPSSPSDSSEEEGDEVMSIFCSSFLMEIYLKIIKTVPLKVKKANKISDVKAKFHDVGGLPPCLQCLFYTGEHLKDEKTLADHDISTGSTVDMFLHPGTKMRISIVNPWVKKKLEIDVMPWDPIHDVEVKIYSRTRIRVSQQNILYNGILLEDRRTLADYGVQDESILVLIQAAGDIRVDVSMPNREKISLEVKQYFTVLNVRQIAESMWSTSLDQHSLIYDGVSLTDDQTLDKCDVEEYSTLRFVARKPLSIYVVVTDLGKTLCLRVQSSNTVIEVLDKIELKLGEAADKLRLFFSERELTDDEVLAECEVGEGSTLKLVILKETIFVKTPTGKNVTIWFKSTDTVETIKRKIKHKEGTPIDHQRLIFDGWQLESSQTLASCNVSKESTMHLLYRLRGC